MAAMTWVVRRTLLCVAIGSVGSVVAAGAAAGASRPVSPSLDQARATGKVAVGEGGALAFAGDAALMLNLAGGEAGGDDRWQSFVAEVAVGADAAERTVMVFEVKVDGRRVARSEAMRPGQAGRFEVDIGQAKTLTLETRDVSRRGRGGVGVWSDAKLSTEPAGPPMRRGKAHPDRSVQLKLFFDTTIAGQPERRSYLLGLPEPVETMRANNRTYPMLIFLHGIIEGGDDHENLFIEAIPRYLRDRPGFVNEHRFVYLCPQAPFRQRFDRPDIRAYVIDLIEHVRDTYPVDAERIYLTGLSDGAGGAWAIARDRPDLFAAIAPVSGRGYQIDAADPTIARLPAWIIVGGRDGKFVEAAFDLARGYAKGGGTFAFGIVPHFGHVIWDQAFLDERLYAWLGQQRRARPAEQDQAADQDRAADQAARRAEVAALDALEAANDLNNRRKAVAAYMAFGRIVERYGQTVAAACARRQMRAVQDDPKQAQKLQRAADEQAAGEMLRIARDHLAADRRAAGVKLLRQVADMWPLTEAAEQARRKLQTLGAD